MQTEKYQAAIETHKFYDTVSISIVGGMITVSGATIYLLEKIPYSIDKIGTIAISSVIITALLVVYRHTSHYANIARNVSAKIESGYTSIGVSTVLKNIKQESYKEYRAEKKWYRGIYGTVHFMWAGIIFGFIALGVTIY